MVTELLSYVTTITAPLILILHSKPLVLAVPKLPLACIAAILATKRHFFKFDVVLDHVDHLLRLHHLLLEDPSIPLLPNIQSVYMAIIAVFCCCSLFPCLIRSFHQVCIPFAASSWSTICICAHMPTRCHTCLAYEQPRDMCSMVLSSWSHSKQVALQGQFLFVRLSAVGTPFCSASHVYSACLLPLSSKLLLHQIGCRSHDNEPSTPILLSTSLKQSTSK